MRPSCWEFPPGRRERAVGGRTPWALSHRSGQDLQPQRKRSWRAAAGASPPGGGARALAGLAKESAAFPTDGQRCRKVSGRHLSGVCYAFDANLPGPELPGAAPSQGGLQRQEKLINWGGRGFAFLLGLSSALTTSHITDLQTNYLEPDILKMSPPTK